VLFESPISKKENQEINVVISIKKKAIIEEPERPKNLPNKLSIIKERRGKYKTSKYIFF